MKIYMRSHLFHKQHILHKALKNNGSQSRHRNKANHYTNVTEFYNNQKFKTNKTFMFTSYSRTCVKHPLSERPKNGIQDRVSLNAGQKYCRMLQREHSAMLLTFIKLTVVIRTFVLSIFQWSFYTVFTELTSLDRR